MDRPGLSEHEARDALCEIGRRVWQREYIASNDGNFSVRLGDDRILCTPTMTSKGFMRPDELPIVDGEGRMISGSKPPTSEIKIHLAIYRHRPDVHAVVHVHPPHATAFAVVRRALPKCVLPEVEVFLGEIPLVPYATPGTRAFAEAAVPYLRHHNAFLLTNHGALTVGRDPFEAYYRMETVEQYCRILILASHLGDLAQLDIPAMSELLRIREKLGYIDRRLAKDVSEWCRAGVPPAPPSTGPLPAEARSAGHSCAETSDRTIDRDELIEEIVRRILKRLESRSQR